MDIMSLIDETQRSAILNYISAAEKYPTVSFNKLFTPWANAKLYLFNTPIFNGNSLINSSPISYAKSESEISDAMRELIKNNNFVISYKKFVRANFLQDKETEFEALMALVNPNVLVDNEINNEFYAPKIKIKMRNDKTINICDGAKVMRLLRKFSEAYDLKSKYDEFQIAHSRVLNEKSYDGNLCLSIHPLDFMTSSDNSLNWHSCMNWLNKGEYRRGTVEMMNSYSVITAYVSAKEPFILPDGTEWSNKRWREYFIIGDDFITPIKGYPNWNKDLENIAAERIISLLGRTNYIKIKARNEYDVGILCCDEHLDFNINFQTQAMYNDFQYDEHFFYTDNPNQDFGDFEYSGVSECMVCGDTDCFDEEENESLLSCNFCSPKSYCAMCCELLNDDEYYELDGELLCVNCYDEHAVEDSYTGEIHNRYNLKKVRIRKNENSYRENDIIIYINLSVYNQYFASHARSENQYWNTYNYYLLDDIDEEFFIKAYDFNCTKKEIEF